MYVIGDDPGGETLASDAQPLYPPLDSKAEPPRWAVRLIGAAVVMIAGVLAVVVKLVVSVADLPMPEWLAGWIG
jgi:hypothetical protein